MARGQERERESVAVMCNGEFYRGRRACEAKRDLIGDGVTCGCPNIIINCCLYHLQQHLF